MSSKIITKPAEMRHDRKVDLVEVPRAIGHQQQREQTLVFLKGRDALMANLGGITENKYKIL